MEILFDLKANCSSKRFVAVLLTIAFVLFMTPSNAVADSQIVQVLSSPEVHQVSVVLVNWAGNPADGTTAQQVADEVNGAVNDYWSASTGGLIEFKVSSVQDWTALPNPGCDKSGLTPTIWADAQKVANWTPGQLKHLLVILPTTSPCNTVFQGIAQKTTSRTQGGMAILVNHNIVSIAHELGHTLSVGHSNGLICSDNGPTPDSSLGNCQVLAYGDSHDMMGLDLGQKGVLSAANLARLGLTQNFTTVTASGTYPLNVDYSEGPVRALSLTLGGDSYLLDYKGIDPKNTWNLNSGVAYHPGVAAYRTISNLNSVGGGVSGEVSLGDAFRLNILPFRLKIKGGVDSSVSDAVATQQIWYGLDNNRIWFQVLPTTTSTLAQVMIVIGSDPTLGKGSYSQASNQSALPIASETVSALPSASVQSDVSALTSAASVHLSSAITRAQAALRKAPCKDGRCTNQSLKLIDQIWNTPTGKTRKVLDLYSALFQQSLLHQADTTPPIGATVFMQTSSGSVLTQKVGFYIGKNMVVTTTESPKGPGVVAISLDTVTNLGWASYSN